jgi:hypothetical protein
MYEDQTGSPPLGLSCVSFGAAALFVSRDRITPCRCDSARLYPQHQVCSTSPLRHCGALCRQTTTVTTILMMFAASGYYWKLDQRNLLCVPRTTSRLSGASSDRLTQITESKMLLPRVI